MSLAEHYKKLKEVGDVEKDGQESVREFLKMCKVHDVNDVTVQNVAKFGVKDVIAAQLVNAFKLIERQNMLIVNQKDQISAHLSDLNTCKSDVIRLQEELLHQAKVKYIDIDDEVVDRLSTAVQNSVVSGMSKTYSEAAQSSVNNVSVSPVIPKETLKSLAKELAVEEELGHNIMVFGLAEEKDEQLSTKVSEVFEHLGQKPKIEVISRVGKQRSDAVARPVKVSLSSLSVVQTILSKSKNLRTNEKFRTVFLSPDRTPKQRSQHKKLVEHLKCKRTQEPDKKHFIKSGEICSIDVSSN